MSDLPPLDQPQAYVVVGPNDQRGPYTMDLLINEVLADRLIESTPVWWPGLADWTTMSGHPGVASELARRRAAVPAAAPAPAWADPSTAGQAPADPFAAPAPAAPQPAEPAPAAQDPIAHEPAAPQPVADQPIDEEPVEAEIVEVVEVEVVEVEVVDPAHLEAFSAWVARSAVRADLQGRIDSINDQLVNAVAAGVVAQGFTLAERVDVDRAAELRFDGPSADLVAVSLGRVAATRIEDLREDHVPVTISYRASASVSTLDEGEGAHGEVVVTADEWTGQSTSSVSLFLALGDYIDGEFAVDAQSVIRDVGAAVAVLRNRLG